MKTMPRRFGLFVHWGPYSVLGWQEQVRMRRGMSRAEYADAVSSFSPAKYDPEAWVLMAKEAGMEYICFTAKHHDGFCMWDTQTTDFNIVRSCGRDVLRELADACQKHGMALSIYYSIPDWNRPDAYNELSTHQCPPEDGDIPDSVSYRRYILEQARELLTGYGPVYTWFWDIPPRIYDSSLNEAIRPLMPGILISDRGYSEGDFSTPERSVPDGDMFEEYTEACESVGSQSWGYRADEDYYTPAFLTRCMDKILLMGGSYLLNVGPDADGVIPEQAASLIRHSGAWYNSVREAFGEGVIPCKNLTIANMWAARKGDTLYLHTRRTPDCSGLSLSPLDKLPQSVVLLNTGEEIRCSLETHPSDFTGTFGQCKPPVLRLKNVPLPEDGCPLVFRLTF